LFSFFPLFLASSCLYFQSPLPLYQLSFPFYVLLCRYIGCSIKFCALVWSKFMFLLSVTPKIHNLHFMSFKVGLRSNGRRRTRDAMQSDHNKVIQPHCLLLSEGCTVTLQCRLLWISHTLIKQTEKEYESCRCVPPVFRTRCTFSCRLVTVASTSDRNWTNLSELWRVMNWKYMRKTRVSETGKYSSHHSFRFRCAPYKWIFASFSVLPLKYSCTRAYFVLWSSRRGGLQISEHSVNNSCNTNKCTIL
jgi:hypothetical protein